MGEVVVVLLYEDFDGKRQFWEKKSRWNNNNGKILRKCFHVAECCITYCKTLVMERIFKIVLSKQRSSSQVKMVAFRITGRSAQQTSNLCHSITFSSRNGTFTTNFPASFRN
jgi:hypothetical protein